LGESPATKGIFQLNPFVLLCGGRAFTATGSAVARVTALRGLFFQKSLLVARITYHRVRQVSVQSLSHTLANQHFNACKAATILTVNRMVTLRHSFQR